jgi:biotin operon repressor
MGRPKLPRPTPRMQAVLDLIMEHGPISPNDLTDKDGLCRADIDAYIRELRKDGLIHIHSYDPSPCRDGYTVKLYVAGPGEDAKRPKPPRRKYSRKGGSRSASVVKGRELKELRRAQEIVHIPPRDFLTAAMFGEVV